MVEELPLLDQHLLTPGDVSTQVPAKEEGGMPRKAPNEIVDLNDIVLREKIQYSKIKV